MNKTFSFLNLCNEPETEVIKMSIYINTADILISMHWKTNSDSSLDHRNTYSF